VTSFATDVSSVIMKKVTSPQQGSAASGLGLVIFFMITEGLARAGVFGCPDYSGAWGQAVRTDWRALVKKRSPSVPSPAPDSGP
jgi:hypothetical protein